MKVLLSHFTFLCTLCTLYIVEYSMACGPLWKLYKPKIEYSRAPEAKRTKKGHKKQLQKKRSNSPFTKFASNAFPFLKLDFLLSVFHSFQVWRSKKNNFSFRDSWVYDVGSLESWKGAKECPVEYQKCNVNQWSVHQCQYNQYIIHINVSTWYVVKSNWESGTFLNTIQTIHCNQQP